MLKKLWPISKKRKPLSMEVACINIGCGLDIRQGWLNCDKEPRLPSVVSFDINDDVDLAWLKTGSFRIVECNHVVGYLNLGQAKRFFATVLASLQVGGKLILEFPDLDKIMLGMQAMGKSSYTQNTYIEWVRAIYAFDAPDAEALDFAKPTYVFGWTSDFLFQVLLEVGFDNIVVLDPETHGKRIYRDSRIEAYRGC